MKSKNHSVQSVNHFVASFCRRRYSGTLGKRGLPPETHRTNHRCTRLPAAAGSAAGRLPPSEYPSCLSRGPWKARTVPHLGICVILDQLHSAHLPQNRFACGLHAFFLFSSVECDAHEQARGRRLGPRGRGTREPPHIYPNTHPPAHGMCEKGSRRKTLPRFFDRTRQ